MEKQKYHEVIRPARELVQQLGEWAMGKIVPEGTVSALFNGPQAEQPELPFEE